MEAYMSLISAFGCNFVIQNWGACSGGLVAISQNNALFALLGTTYGGNGTVTFGLPDLRGRAPISYGQGSGLSNRVLGQIGGLEHTTLLSLNLPVHAHSVSIAANTQAGETALPVSNDTAGQNAADGNFLATTLGANRVYADTLSSPAGTMGPIGIPASPVMVQGMTGVSGNNTPVPTQSPYQAVNYQICMYGIFPSRA